MTTSIAACRAAGITFEAHEAVAITQQLIDSLSAAGPDELRAPFGPPTAENVFLGADGSVDCPACGVTPAVSEVGRFLDDLLGGGLTRIPGGLRYTVARALLNVDVPPFDSLGDLSRDLARHERGTRAEVVQAALARMNRPRLIAAPPIERRRSHASATTLRRELREADARLYLQQTEPRNQPAVIDLVAAAAPAPRRGRPLTATAACLAAGFSLIAVGEIMYSHRAPVAGPLPAMAETRIAPAAALPVPDPLQVVAADEPLGDRAIPSPQAGIIAVRNVSSRTVHAPRGDAPRFASKRTTRPATPPTVSRRSTTRPAQRGVFDRLRLGWLRNAFTGRSRL